MTWRRDSVVHDSMRIGMTALDRAGDRREPGQGSTIDGQAIGHSEGRERASATVGEV